MPARTPDRRGSSASRGYDGTWRRLRAAHLTGYPLCVFCEQAGRVTLAAVVDHVIPFRGREDPLRLDPRNLQSLCKTCHNAVKQAQDKGSGLRGTALDGSPLDPSHHWARKG
jgi:5-methylcytosine-specific restriction endonuclease McrA